MLHNPEKPNLIVRRLADGSFYFTENKDTVRCDADGAELWVTPSGQLYCHEIHVKPAGPLTDPFQNPTTEPHKLSAEEWKEIVELPIVREAWGLDDNTTPEEFAEMVYGVRFDFVSGGPGYIGDLYVLCGDALGEPLTIIRTNGALEAI